MFDADMIPDGRFVVTWSENDGSFFNGISNVYAENLTHEVEREAPSYECPLKLMNHPPW
jgi:hypothetical protein